MRKYPVTKNSNFKYFAAKAKQISETVSEVNRVKIYIGKNLSGVQRGKFRVPNNYIIFGRIK